jgi:diguanylate cyclase (GGDEF)-like protein/PAS domain S-box-containing protein
MSGSSSLRFQYAHDSRPPMRASSHSTRLPDVTRTSVALRSRADGDDVERLQAAVDEVVAAARVGPCMADEGIGRLDDMLIAERYQRAALDAVPEAWLFLRAVWDDAGRVADFVVLDLNAAGVRLSGHSRSTLIGGSFCELLPIHRQLGLFEWYLSVIETGEPFEDERCVITEAGEERWMHVRAVPIPGGIAVATHEIDDRRRDEAARARLAAILEASPDIVTIAGTDGRIQYVNHAGRAMLGLPSDAMSDDAFGLTVAEIQPQLLEGGALHEATRRANAYGVWRGETTLRKRDGREIPVEQVLLAHLGANGTPAYYSSVMRDITDRKQAEAALRSLSLVDELTGLYNRRGFLTVAGPALARARERSAPVLVFYMDVDDFKQVNDAHGHGEGDAALVAVADVLRATFRESDVVGRLGGDEFVAFAVHGSGMDSARIARAVVARLQQRLAALNTAGTCACAIRVSVGVAGVPAGPESAGQSSLDALLAQADAALYAAKRRKTDAAA